MRALSNEKTFDASIMTSYVSVCLTVAAAGVQLRANLALAAATLIFLRLFRARKAAIQYECRHVLHEKSSCKRARPPPLRVTQKRTLRSPTCAR